MQKITINDRAYELPETWQEVGLKKLPEILNLTFAAPEDGEMYLEIIRVLLGFSPKKWRKFIRNYFGQGCTPQQLIDNAETFGWLIKSISWMRDQELTLNPFPEGIDANGEKWIIFEDGFKSMTFGELTNAYIHSQAFVKQLVEGEDRLNLLFATVCRPKAQGDYEQNPAWNGDHREPYNEHAARNRSEVVTGKFVKEKVLVLVYFMSTLKEFFSYYDLFESDTIGPPQPEEYPGQSMVKNQHLLSEKHIFGGMTDTKNANVHEVFQFLEENKKDMQAANKRAEAQRKEYDGI